MVKEKPLEPDQKSDAQINAISNIVTAAIENDVVTTEKEILSMISNVAGAIDLDNTGDFVASSNPAVPIDQSIQPDYIVCLEDGAKLRLLKRYLRTHFNMTPEEYRRKWGLPADYPMCAPNYTQRRSALAKEIGLGTKKIRPRARKRKAA